MTPAFARAALLVDDSRFDYLDMRNLLLGSQAGVERLEWLQQWPGSDEALAKGPFDLIFVDMHLGSARGLDVIRDLRAAGVRIPVIALTGQANDEIDRACAEAGASDFLVKGLFDRTMLERAIRYAEHQAAAQQELDRLNSALERRAIAENDQARVMRAAIEQAAEGVFITDAAERIDGLSVVYVNAALCALAGRRAGELLGSDALALFVADGDAVVPDASILPLAGPSGETVVALNGARGPVPVRIRVAPIRSSDGRVEHFVWWCRGADERERRARLDWRRARHETLGQLTAGIAHDLNERVTALHGHLDLLSRRLHDDLQHRSLAGAVEAADRVSTLAGLLVSFSDQADAPADATVELPVMLATMKPLLQQAVGGLVKLDVAVDDDVAAVRIDAARLQLALLELALNARDAMPDGGTLRVACHPPTAQDDAALAGRSRDFVALSFTDTGVGMTAEVLAQARRRDFTTKPADRGTGAGLALVEQAIGPFGGTLELASRVGHGTTATLYLPRATVHDPTTEPADASA